ncbi:MAG TPA: glycosyltransferase [Ferruginibacter sp.]|nr:glycosyltransferase [Ferruginibacter sp.]
MLNKPKFKVAIVYHFFAHYRGSIINKLLENEQIEYSFIGGKKKNSFYSALKLFDFENNSRFIEVTNNWFGGYYLWQSGLINALKQEKFDCVIFLGDWKFLSTWLAVFYLNIKRTPTLFWSHGLLNNVSSLNTSIKLLFFNRFKFGGFVYDNRAKNILASKGYSKNVNVVYNSLDYNGQVSIINSLTDADYKTIKFPKNKYVIFSGRIDERKELKLLVKALSILKSKNNIVDALIIGDGAYLDELRNYANELDVLEQFIFYGSCYDERVLAMYFIKSIACVVPSAVGLTAIHSLTYGVPVITNNDIYSHGPEIEAVQDNKTGTFFEKGNAESLASKIEIFVNASVNTRNMYRENAGKMIKQNFTPENQLLIFNKRLFEIFENIM